MLKGFAFLVLPVWAVGGQPLCKAGRAGCSCWGKRCPPQGPSVTAVRTCEFPLPVRLGAPWSPSAQRHGSAVWHTCNLRCFQDCPSSPSPDNTGVGRGVSDTILYNFMAPVFMYCALAARTRHWWPFLHSTMSEKAASSFSAHGDHCLRQGSVRYAVWHSISSIHVFIQSDVLSHNDYVWIKSP